MTAVGKSTSEKLPANPAYVLIADDEHLAASGLSEHLREIGYEVVGPAADGTQAIELCRLHQPDMAMLDIRMPNTDGLQAAENIFHELAIPVMIFSAYSDKQYIEQSNRLGVFGYLIKPITREQLRVSVSVAWGRYLDYVQQNNEIETLRKRLEDRKTIEKAKWIVVKRKQISEPEAMRTLQQQARNNRKPLVEVARSILENEELFGNT